MRRHSNDKQLKPSVPYGWNRKLGDCLRHARKSQGITIEDAEIASGFSRQAMRGWERGENARLESFCLYCFTLGLKPSEVMQKAGL